MKAIKDLLQRIRTDRKNRQGTWIGIDESHIILNALEKSEQLQTEIIELRARLEKAVELLLNALEKSEQLQTEIIELRARLEKAVELPVRIGNPMWYVVKNAITPWIVSTSVTEITIYEDEIVVNLKNTHRRLVLDYNGEVIGNYYEIYLDKNSAEARLKELQGGER